MTYPVWHNKQVIPLLDPSRFNFAHDHRPQLIVFLANGQHKSSVEIPVEDLDIVEVFQKRRATIGVSMPRVPNTVYTSCHKSGSGRLNSLVPRRNLLVYPVLHVLPYLGRDGYKRQIGFRVESDRFQEW